MGFTPCRADPCLFVRRGSDGSTVYVVLYVDDLLVGCKHEEEADAICRELGTHFLLKSLGDARFVLGMEINYNMEKGELHLKQRQFITKMVAKFGCGDAYAVRNPLVRAKTSCPATNTSSSTTRPSFAS